MSCICCMCFSGHIKSPQKNSNEKLIVLKGSCLLFWCSSTGMYQGLTGNQYMNEFYNLFIPCPFENSLRNICKLLVYSCYSIVFTFEFNSVLVELQKKLLFYSWCRYLGMVVVICVLTRNLQNFLYVVVYLFKLVKTLKTLKILSIFQLSWLYNVVACLVTSNPILKI